MKWAHFNFCGRNRGSAEIRKFPRQFRTCNLLIRRVCLSSIFEFPPVLSCVYPRLMPRPAAFIKSSVLCRLSLLDADKSFSLMRQFIFPLSRPPAPFPHPLLFLCDAIPATGSRCDETIGLAGVWQKHSWKPPGLTSDISFCLFA